MKRIMKKYGLPALLALASVGLFTQCEEEDIVPQGIFTVNQNGYSQFNQNALRTQLNALPKEELSAEETAGLLFMLEEEKLAYEVYVSLYEKWGHHSFQNISRAEQYHLGLMKQLATDLGLTIPANVTKAEAGVFSNTDLQKLYDQLMAAGNQSLVAALQAGATIEETDIRDLKAAIAATDEVTAIQTYTTLLRASENHLRAFQRNLERSGASYTPVALSASDYEAIITGKNTCAGDCCQNLSGVNKAACKNGPGKGKNKGKGGGACCNAQ